MKLGSSHILGIAVSDRSITVAELGGRGDRRAIRRTACFDLPEGSSFEKPELLGQELAKLISREGFSTRHAVVGVPARWLIAAEKEVPPASDEQISAILRLQAERMRVSESDELVADYVGEPKSDKTGRVLLIGMMRKQLDRVVRAMETAGLEVAGVTATTVALASALGRGGDGQQPPMLLLSRHGAEVLWRHHGRARMLRHVTTTAGNGSEIPLMAPLSMELRRAVAMVPPPPPNGQGPVPAPTELELWDTVGLNETQIHELSQKLGLRLRQAEGIPALGVATPITTGRSDATRVAPAVALAVAASNRLPLDFRNSRLAPPPQRRLGRLGVWAMVAATSLLVAVTWLYVDVKLRRSELARINTSLNRLAPAVKGAEELSDKVKYTRGYFTTRPPLLEVLREVTLSFRESDAIWATRFNVKENRRGEIEVVLEGKTLDRAVARELSDRLRENPKFVGVTLPSLTEAAPGRSRDQVVSFAINFKFVTAEVKN